MHKHVDVGAKILRVEARSKASSEVHVAKPHTGEFRVGRIVREKQWTSMTLFFLHQKVGPKRRVPFHNSLKEDLRFNLTIPQKSQKRSCSKWRFQSAVCCVITAKRLEVLLKFREKYEAKVGINESRDPDVFCCLFLLSIFCWYLQVALLKMWFRYIVSSSSRCP